MNKVKRWIDLKKLVSKSSFFLFGPRATGKTTLLKELEAHEKPGTVLRIDLLKSDYYIRLQANPSEIEALIKKTHKVVIIDEIQRVPDLLNEVQRLIEDLGVKFILTGSSARKIKKTNSNLLGGRAWRADFFPLVYPERVQAKPRKLLEVLRNGNLPRVYFSPHPDDEIDAYVNNYLREEIENERWVKSIPHFSRFLKASALTAGELVEFKNIASDVGVSAVTVKEYYSILNDTLIGTFLEPYTESKKRKAIATAKFYYFDTGILNSLLEVESLDRNSDLYGKSLEHLICHEIKAYLSYQRIKKPLRFWRSTNQHEVDFLIGNDVAIEVKSAKKMHPKFLKGLIALREESIFKKFYCITHDPLDAVIDGVDCMPIESFLQKLWAGKIIK